MGFVLRLRRECAFMSSCCFSLKASQWSPPHFLCIQATVWKKKGQASKLVRDLAQILSQVSLVWKCYTSCLFIFSGNFQLIVLSYLYCHTRVLFYNGESFASNLCENYEGWEGEKLCSNLCSKNKPFFFPPQKTFFLEICPFVQCPL